MISSLKMSNTYRAWGLGLHYRGCAEILPWKAFGHVFQTLNYGNWNGKMSVAFLNVFGLVAHEHLLPLYNPNWRIASICRHLQPLLTKHQTTLCWNIAPSSVLREQSLSAHSTLAAKERDPWTAISCGVFSPPFSLSPHPWVQARVYKFAILSYRCWVIKSKVITMYW